MRYHSSEENVTTENVAEEIEDLIGQSVTIRSNAIAQIEPATFTVADQEYYGGEDTVVVNATGTPFVLPTENDTEVQISEVTEFVLADIESVYDLNLDPDLYIEYSDRPLGHLLNSQLSISCYSNPMFNVQ